MRPVQRAPVAEAPLERAPHAVVGEGVRIHYLQMAQKRDGLHGGPSPRLNRPGWLSLNTRKLIARTGAAPDAVTT